MGWRRSPSSPPAGGPGPSLVGGKAFGRGLQRLGGKLLARVVRRVRRPGERPAVRRCRHCARLVRHGVENRQCPSLPPSAHVRSAGQSGNPAASLCGHPSPRPRWSSVAITDGVLSPLGGRTRWGFGERRPPGAAAADYGEKRRRASTGRSPGHGNDMGLPSARRSRPGGGRLTRCRKRLRRPGVRRSRCWQRPPPRRESAGPPAPPDPPV